MAVYIYNEMDHPGQFIGIRVVRSINKILHQKYFRFRQNGRFITLKEEQELRAKAQQLDKKWEKEQQKYKRSPLAYRKVQNMPFCGIRAAFIRDKKRRCGEWRIYFYPVFIVSNGNHKSETRFYIGKSGYEKAWEMAVIYYCKKRNLMNEKNKLVKLMPKKEIFKILRKKIKDYKKILPVKKMKQWDLWNES